MAIGNVTPNEIINLLPTPTGEEVILVDDQSIDDIIQGVINKHNKTVGHYDIIAQKFWKGDAKNTAIGLFDFCKKNIPYKAETEKVQTVKVPTTILIDGINRKKNDCKHYASFIMGVTKALHRKGYNIDGKYIFASDKPGAEEATHVFAQITDGQNKWWCDPVLGSFNEPHKYNYFLNNSKMLKEISGANVGLSFNINHPFGDVGDFVKKTVNVNAANAGKALNVNVANLGKGIKIATHDIKTGVVNTVNKGERVILIATLTASRNAFLALVELNVSDVAGKFMSLAQTEQGKNRIKKLWYDIGGNWSSLAHAINSGWKRSGRSLPANYHYIGDAEAVLTAIAAALPVITAFAVLFKELGISINKSSVAASANKLADDHNANGGKHPDGTETQVVDNGDGTKSLVVTKYQNNTGENNWANGTVFENGTALSPTALNTTTNTDVAPNNDGSNVTTYLLDKNGKIIPGSEKRENFFDKIPQFLKDHETGLLWTGGAIVGLGLLAQTKPIKKLFK